MIDYKKIFTDRELRLKLIGKLAFIPDKPYLKMVYRIKTGKKLNLKNPVGFNDKMNWLKLNDRHWEYTDYVDKYKVREIISGKIGEEYLFPLLGVWDSFDDIDFDKLPDKFVLKCNHDSASVKIILDKKTINKKELKNFFDGRMQLNSFCLGREYPYKNVVPKIIAEKFIEVDDKHGLRDYKFFCFDGEPKFLFVATDRSTDVKFDFYDIGFNHIDTTNIHLQSGLQLEKPEKFEEMVELARKLSQGMKFVRIDLYNVDGKIYFGEYTFFHGGGFYLFYPDKYEKIFGDMIKL